MHGLDRIIYINKRILTFQNFQANVPIVKRVKNMIPCMTLPSPTGDNSEGEIQQILKLERKFVVEDNLNSMQPFRWSMFLGIILVLQPTFMVL